MAETNPKVLAMVERALKKDPSTSSTDLHERAKKIDESVAQLGGRQFHARYALRVRKKLAGSTGGRRKAAPKKKAASRKRAAAKKKTAPRKKARRKRGGARRVARRRAAPKAGPALDMLSETFDKQKAALNKALDAAFANAVRADSVTKLNALLADVQETAKKYG